MSIYQPKVSTGIEALQWTGDWEAMSLFCYGTVYAASEEFYDSDHPVVLDDNQLSVLTAVGEQTVKFNDYVQRIGSNGSPYSTFAAWDMENFQAAFYTSWDGSPA